LTCSTKLLPACRSSSIQPPTWLEEQLSGQKKVPKPSGLFSLRIRALGELIEIYCTREATERHDKVFASLGMSSDDPVAAGLSPDYGIPWETLLERLVRYR